MREERSTTRAEERWNAWLSLVLLAVLAVEANLLARDHLVLRFDFSEDRLHVIAPATRRLLGRLDDHLHAKAYFTGAVQSGDLALAKARLLGMLEEYAALSGGRMQVDVVDPESSGEALLEAEQYGLVPYQVRTRQGVVEVRQSVYLGLVLRSRGREQAVPFVLPSTLESAFSQALDNLLRERTRVIGWLGANVDARSLEAGFGSFARAREILASRHELRPIEGLESGQPVGADVDLLIVVRPEALHPRAAFEIDQYLQRGGRLLACVDQCAIHLRSGEVRTSQVTGLEPLLETWGARVTPQHVWDDQNAPITISQRIPQGENQWIVQPVQIDYPLFLRLDRDSFDPELPPVAGLQQGLLCWAQPIEPGPPVPGLTRCEIVQSSADAYRVPLVTRLDFSEEHIAGRTKANYALGPGRRYALAVALSGHFPSPFVSGAPAPWNPFAASASSPAEETVLSAAREAQVVVFGDADWMRDEQVKSNERLLANVVDWLVLDDELLALRSRTPRDRPLRDFHAEELRRRGLDALAADESLGQLDERLREESAAARAARRRQWAAMLVPMAVSLALVLGGGMSWMLRERRAPAGAPR